MKRFALSGAVSLLAMVANAGESRLRLIDAPGRETVQASCGVCHSVDYVLLNAGIPDRKGWEASITKMRKVMAAPISDADAAVILDYLSAHYGKAAN